MTEYIIDFASVFIEASGSDEAWEKALELIREGEVEIDQICKNDR